jgi:diacylglycerol O-acyltransferase
VSAYERLSGLDEAFLAFETPTTYMHVAATAIFDAAPLGTKAGGVDLVRIRQHVEARLPRLPRFRQRLHFVPVTQDAVWIDDDGFDLAYHVRHASLPRPGSDEQLRERVAEILERPLNRARPLWELWIVEGLADDRFALIAKVHHCIVDGIAGVGVLANLLSLEPCEATDTPEDWTPRPAPSDRELLRDEATRRLRGSLTAGRSLAGTLAHPLSGARRVGATAAGLWRLAQQGLRIAPATFFNRPIGPHRRVSWLAVELDPLRDARQRLGGTLNDVVLACVAGALRTLLARHRRLPVEGIVRAAVPVSVRGRDEVGVPGNRVSIWIVPLPVYERDPGARVAAVTAVTGQLKRRNDAAGATVLTQAADWTGGALRSWAARLIASMHIYDLIVTNVPGPPVPLYLLGARMQAAYPHLPLFENQGLGIALLSYCDRLYVGLTADWAQGALVAELTADLAEEVAHVAAAEASVAARAQPAAPSRVALPRAVRPRLRPLSVRG